MPLVPMRQILEEATKGGYGVGAFNVNNMEQIQAIMEAANETNSPVIIQASRGALQYSRMIYLKKLIEAAVEEYPHIPVAMHLDHGDSLETCMKAIDLGFTSVMIDGSLKDVEVEKDGKKKKEQVPREFEENVEITRKVVEVAHKYGVTVEGEVGCLGGIEDGHGIEDKEGKSLLTEKDLEEERKYSPFLTDPEEAERFVKETGVDALAVAIGTSHGAFKSNRKHPVTKEVLPPIIAVSRVKKIHERIPEVPLVMHGSSSVPQELVDIINECGGELKDTAGVPIEKIQEAIKYGVRKINVDTDSRLAMTGAIRKYLKENPSKFDPRDYLKPAREAMKKVYVERMIAFGQAGHAGDYKPLTLDDMKCLYSKMGK
ncbi:MAG: ketose-bisphosphate aldolase [Candidatus Hydrogenedentes bacterium]|nr:ketose-bisphosphate aldolase [Candidatus Hydrogenedentota bacterium]